MEYFQLQRKLCTDLYSIEAASATITAATAPTIVIRRQHWHLLALAGLARSLLCIIVRFGPAKAVRLWYLKVDFIICILGENGYFLVSGEIVLEATTTILTYFVVWLESTALTEQSTSILR